MTLPSSRADREQGKFIEFGGSVTVNAKEPDLTQKIENNASGQPIYVGKAVPGSATSSAVWQIQKITYDGSGFLTDVQWGGGSSNFDQVWDDRAAGSYS